MEEKIKEIFNRLEEEIGEKRVQYLTHNEFGHEEGHGWNMAVKIDWDAIQRVKKEFI